MYTLICIPIYRILRIQLKNQHGFNSLICEYQREYKPDIYKETVYMIKNMKKRKKIQKNVSSSKRRKNTSTAFG